MRFMLPSSVRANLLLVILAGILPMVVVILWTGDELRKKEQLEAEAGSQLICGSLASQQEAITLGVKQLLSTLAQLPEVQGLDVKKCSLLFENLLELNPHHGNIVLLNTNGDALASGRAFLKSNIMHLKHVADAKNRLEFSAGQYQVGSISKVPVFSFAFPVMDFSGRLVGILATSLKLDRYYAMFELTAMPPGTVFEVLDDTGVRMVRYPEGEKSRIGTPVSPNDWLQYFASVTPKGLKPYFEDHEGHSDHMDEDDARRHYISRQLRLNPGGPPYMIFTVGIPEAQIIAKADAVTIRYLIWLSVASLLSLATAYLIGKRGLVIPLKKMANTAKQLESGDLEARTGLEYLVPRRETWKSA
ncbi:MAG: PAS/PAC sensor hybrid histidine kinase, partial [uncultured bacterium]